MLQVASKVFFTDLIDRKRLFLILVVNRVKEVEFRLYFDSV